MRCSGRASGCASHHLFKYNKSWPQSTLLSDIYLYAFFGPPMSSLKYDMLCGKMERLLRTDQLNAMKVTAATARSPCSKDRPTLLIQITTKGNAGKMYRKWWLKPVCALMNPKTATIDPSTSSSSRGG